VGPARRPGRLRPAAPAVSGPPIGPPCVVQWPEREPHGCDSSVRPAFRPRDGADTGPDRTGPRRWSSS